VRYEAPYEILHGFGKPRHDPAGNNISYQATLHNLRRFGCYAVTGKSVCHHHRHSAWHRTARGWVYRDTRVTEMDGATGSIYSGDPGVDRLHLTRSFRDFVDPHNCVDSHGRVVSYLLTLFLRFSNQNRSFSRIPIGMPAEVQRSVDDGLSAFQLRRFTTTPADSSPKFNAEANLARDQSPA